MCKSKHFGQQEYLPMVEGDRRERTWNKAAVPARAKARRLHRPHHLHFGEAGSHPCGRPLHHPFCDENLQERALSIWQVQRERESPWHRQQAVLHQLVGHVLALRPCQEAPDWIKFAPGLHHVCTLSLLGLDKVCT